jgi:hypothetical protein
MCRPIRGDRPRIVGYTEVVAELRTIRLAAQKRRSRTLSEFTSHNRTSGACREFLGVARFYVNLNCAMQRAPTSKYFATNHG